MLNDLFSEFDKLAELHGLEKIKTIGDAYMVAGGLPNPKPDHVDATAKMGLAMLDVVRRHSAIGRPDFAIRIGMDTGSVIAGVIGRHKFIYDLWGDTVNTASRMESHGVAGAIQVTKRVRDQLKGSYRFRSRGVIEVKGKERMEAFILLPPKINKPTPA
jgi:guanylate cyclase